MLPSISLDEERFQDIMEKARKMLPSLAPQWTDYNYHDPGITFIELFAWMKEMQQYHMDQIGQQHRLGYLRLLGMAPAARTPAEVYLGLGNIKEEGYLPKGSRFFAGQVCFETAKSQYLNTASLIRGVSFYEGERHYLINSGTGPDQLPKGALFGPSPKGGEWFGLGLDKPLKPGFEHRLTFFMWDSYPIKRNPILNQEEFEPLARFRLEYLGSKGWMTAQIQTDSTCGFLQDGVILFSLAEDMREEKGLYWLRFVLEESEYDVAPVAVGISLNSVLARQEDTLAESHKFTLFPEAPKSGLQIEVDSYLGCSGEYELFIGKGGQYRQWEGDAHRTFYPALGKAVYSLEGLPADTEEIKILCFQKGFADSRIAGIGNELPNETFDLKRTGLMAEGFGIMVETAPGTGVFEEWSMVADFALSSPEDRHYQVAEETGTLAFGDCFLGMAPKGQIRIIGCKLSLGSQGNAKAGRITRYEGPYPLGFSTNRANADGGHNPETIDACFERYIRESRQTERAVTYSDYEALVKRTPGLRIASARAVPVTSLKKQDSSMEEQRMTVVAVPYSTEETPKLTPAYIANISRMLEPRRMLGTSFTILSPEYTGISLFGEIRTDSYYMAVKNQIQEAIEAYFKEYAWEFGRLVRYSTVYGIIDTLECVKKIQSLTINAQGKGVRHTRNGDIQLPANGLAYLKECQCVISPIQ